MLHSRQDIHAVTLTAQYHPASKSETTAIYHNTLYPLYTTIHVYPIALPPCIVVYTEFCLQCRHTRDRCSLYDLPVGPSVIWILWQPFISHFCISLDERLIDLKMDDM